MTTPGRRPKTKKKKEEVEEEEGAAAASLKTHEFLMREEIRKLLSSLRAFEPKTVSNGKQEFLSIPDLPNFSSSPSRFQKTSAAAVTCLQP